MNGADFIRKIRKAGRRNQIDVHFESRRGKGSHGRLHYGQRFTTVKDRKKDISPGLLKAMLTQLGLDKDDID